MNKRPNDTKSKLHPRNKHRQRYDFEKLIEVLPELAGFVSPNKYGDQSVDFFDSEAVKMLNKALLKRYYKIEQWDIPAGYLCPPIPGRADYIHHIADHLARSNEDKIPEGAKVKCLDVGVGANCIYPIIGQTEYGWSFIGSEIDPKSIKSANRIISQNKFLQDKIEIRKQPNPRAIFNNIIDKEEYLDLTICNPPFHKSEAQAKAGTQRKLKNLKSKTTENIALNFGGKSNELWYKGGEEEFIRLMIDQSKLFATNCFWFSTLVSKEAHLKSIYKMLKRRETTQVETIEMGQGNKKSRIVAWTFLNPKQQKVWRDIRWK